MQTVRRNLFSDQVARRIIIDLFSAHVDGERFPNRPLTPANGHFLKAYESFFVRVSV